MELQNTDDREGRRDKGKGKQVVRYSDDEESSDDDSFTVREYLQFGFLAHIF